MNKSVVNLSEYSQILTEQGSVDNVVSAIGVKSCFLAQLQNNQIQVPHGFSLRTSVFEEFKATDHSDIKESVWAEIMGQVAEIEAKTGKKLGSTENPLFLVARGDATSEATGMLSTVINVGFNDLTARGLELKTRNRAFVYDSYSRFIRTYATVVIGISTTVFDNLIDQFMVFRQLKSYSEFTAIEWIEMTKLFKSLILKRTGVPFPQDPLVQLRKVIAAIMRTNFSENITKYRNVFHLTNNFGFSMIIQEVVNGNCGQNSFSAVVSSRNPITGGPDLSGVFCNNSFVGDIKKGMCACKPIAALQGKNNAMIAELSKKIELAFGGPQTIDFVFNESALYVIGIKPVMFSGSARFAAVRDMSNAGVISKEAALMCLTPEDLNALSGTVIEKEPRTPLIVGTPAGAGVVVGKIVLNAQELYKPSKSLCVYFKPHITPLDFSDVVKAAAVVCCDEGTSSFAARLLRLLRKPAILDGKMVIDHGANSIAFEDKVYKSGDTVTVGSTGKLFPKAQKVGPPKHSAHSPAKTILEWADGIRSGRMFVFSPANTVDDLKAAKDNGADGLSCFAMDSLITAKRIDVIKTYAEKKSDKGFSVLEKALAADLQPIIRTGNATILLFDAPLSSYMPNPVQLIEEVAVLRVQKEHKEANDEEFKKEKDLNLKASQIEAIKKCSELNPLLGVHGARMNILNEPLLKIQINAIIAASKETGAKTIRILIPSIMCAGEVKAIKAKSEALIKDSGIKVLFGASIDSSRGCLMAGEIANEVDFLAISTTGLQMSGFGMSQADSDKSFMTQYLENAILPSSPFVSVDDEALGEIMREAVQEARTTKPTLEIMIYGDQCGDARSIKFCSTIGVASIACPLPMIPVAKLCCAQAVISSQ